MKIITTSLLFLAVFFAGSMVERIDPRAPLGLALNEAEAGPVRRSSRRTARRTSRRVSRRHNYYGGGYRPYHPVATGAAVAATALAVGTVVHSLPPSCSKVVIDNRVYQDCGETYYAPRYDGPDVVYVVTEPPR
ncbi:MAG: DUF6515 family protein [Pseudomonadota bacterium]|nr:DUF6515 family protein [Pseudomonadota bacterium]